MQIKLDNLSLDKYDKFITMLNNKWFFSPCGIHGVIHIKRVLIYILFLSGELNLNEKDIDLLCYCTIYHDIGRSDDYIDYNHGIESHKKLTSLNLHLPNDDEDKKIIKFIIENHCKDDILSIKSISDYKILDTVRAEHLFKIFKDCDALDRVRVNRLDSSYLRFEESKKYIPIAWEIFNNPQKINILLK